MAPSINALADNDPLAAFFGEDQARYVVTVKPENLDRVQSRAENASVFAPWIGSTGGRALALGDSRALAVDELRKAHELWFPSYMEGTLA